MRKWMLLSVLVGLLVALVIGVTQATPTDELTTLASYYPEDTPFFAVIRTDAGYIETLDGFLGQVNENVGGLLGNVSVADLLDLAAFQVVGSSYDEAFGSWLGGSVAVGVSDFSFIADTSNLDPSDVPAVVALEITDKALATAFAEGLVGGSTGAFETLEEEGYTIISTEGTAALVTDEIMLIGTSATALTTAFELGDASLQSSETFTRTTGGLPNGDYNIVFYVNGGELTEQMNAITLDLYQSLGLVEIPGVLMGMQADPGTIALGFTIMDGRSLVIDTSVVLGDEAQAAMQAMPGYTEPVAFNPEFAAHIPAENAQLIILDNGFGPEFLALFDMLDTVAPSLQLMLDALIAEETMREEMGDAAVDLLEPIDISGLRFGGILQNYITPWVAGFTGLNLEDDILSWMTGDYALFISLIPVESDLGISFDVGMIVENTDGDAARNMLEGLQAAGDAYGGEGAVATETIGTGDAIVFDELIRIPFSLADDPIPDLAMQTPELDFIVGLSDDLFVMSSRPGAEFALNPEGASLVEDPAYAYAAENLILDDAVTLWFIGTPAIINALPALESVGASPSDLEQASFFLSQIESLTISAHAPEDGVTAARLSITVGAGTASLDAVEPEATEEATEEAAAEPAEPVVTRFDGISSWITDDGYPSLGDPNAPVELVIYSSFGCPHCRTFSDTTLNDVLEEVVAGNVYYVYVPLAAGPMQNINESHRAGFCAAQEGKFWQYHEAMFALQDVTDTFEESALIAAATDVGIDTEAFVSCLASDRPDARIEAANARADAMSVAGTPSFEVNGELLPPGTDLLGALSSAGI